MKIISKYKQPYDNVQWHCEDDIVWRRNPRKISRAELNTQLCNLIYKRHRYRDYAHRYDEHHGWLVVGTLAIPIIKHRNPQTGVETFYRDTVNGLVDTIVENSVSPILLITWVSPAWRIPDNETLSIIADVEFDRDSSIWGIIGAQSISQLVFNWLCNKAVPEVNTEIDNDVRIQQHGFDLKTSFRGKNK